MKKVLALVLAVIMVCTMAMAVTIGGASEWVDPTAPIVGEAKDYAAVIPGNSIIFTTEELKIPSNVKATNCTVTVTFDKGSDLVATKGWVKTGADEYKYVITTKTSSTATQDDKADIVISAIKVVQTGVKAPLLDAKYSTKDADGNVLYYVVNNNTYKANDDFSGAATKKLGTDVDDTWMFVMAFDYGYKADKITLNKDMDLVVNVNTIYTVEKGNVKAVDVTEKDAGVEFTYSLKAGQKVMFTKVGFVADLGEAATKKLNENVEAKEAEITPVVENVMAPNAPIAIYVDNQKEGAKLYMVNADGTLKDLNAKFDDNKVLTATATITGPVILSDKALTSTSTETGTTTNPGTGANDVVGVAAALAVVALVSGAAISLKK